MGGQMMVDPNLLVDYPLDDHFLDDLGVRYDRSFTLSHRGNDID
jgi:hypothetical protein